MKAVYEFDSYSFDVGGERISSVTFNNNIMQCDAQELTLY